jgi:hypothetical protein
VRIEAAEHTEANRTQGVRHGGIQALMEGGGRRGQYPNSGTGALEWLQRVEPAVIHDRGATTSTTSVHRNECKGLSFQVFHRSVVSMPVSGGGLRALAQAHCVVRLLSGVVRFVLAGGRWHMLRVALVVLAGVVLVEALNIRSMFPKMEPRFQDTKQNAKPGQTWFTDEVLFPLLLLL